MTPRTITITENWTITDGPNGEDLFLSLRKIKEEREVQFELLEREVRGQLHVSKGRVRLKARIMGIEPEDDSGLRWCLKVRFLSNEIVEVTNRNPVDVYYQEGGEGRRRGGQVTDATPFAERLRVLRNGNIYRGANVIGNIRHLPANAASLI